MNTNQLPGQKGASFEHVAIVVALQQMFNVKRYFDICALNAALDTAGIKVAGEQMAPFRALHCVDYANMPPGFKQQLTERVLALFSLPPDYQIHIEPSRIAEPKRKWFGLLEASSIRST